MPCGDPLHNYLSPQGCPTHSMAIKHNTRRWNLQKYAKRVLFKANLAIFSAPQEVFEPTDWVQNPLGWDQRCLFIIYVGSNANGPLHRHARLPNCPRRGAFFGRFSQILKHRSATCEASSQLPLLSVLLKFCVMVLHTHSYHPPNYGPNLHHHDGGLIFCPFCTCFGDTNPYKQHL